VSALALPFEKRHEHALGRSFVLAALVHIALAAVLFLGVRWQVHAPDTVEVELVAPPPPPVEAPKPVPKVEPPPPPKVEPKPEPKVEKPDIALREKPKPKPKPEPKPKPKPEPKPEPKPKPKAEVKPKPDPEFQKRLQEQVAMEQKALEAQQQERVLRELIARQQADAARQASTARAKALNEYIALIQAKVRGNWILPPDLRGNPEAVFDVVQLPTGEVLTIRIARSSGNPAYDNAVERAIRKSSPLPLPASRELFSRELKLTFRPQDK
jgi:colicin import membrane protein